MSGASLTVVRIASAALCAADDAITDARRHLFTGGHPADADTVIASTALIEIAISQLVKARAELNGAEIVEAL